MKSKAVITDGFGHFEIDEIEVNPPGPGEIMLQIKASGLCHTDWDSLNWKRPLIPGHEGAGIIVECGSGVTKFKNGERVLLNWALACGHCFQCGIGNRHICEEYSFVTGNGSGHAAPEATLYKGRPLERSFNLGTLAQYTVVKQEAVVPIINDLPFPSACIIGCGVMTGYGSAVNAAKVQAGSSAAIIGCGGVGLNVIQGCRISGAAKIIAIDVNEKRLEMAREFGATHTIVAETEDRDFIKIRKKVKNLTTRGADYAFECTAIPALGAAPLALIRNAGIAVQLSGIEQKIDFDAELFEWDKQYINPLYGQCNPGVDFPRIQELYRTGQLKLDELVSKTYSIEELPQAFDDMLHGNIAKGVIIF